MYEQDFSVLFWTYYTFCAFTFISAATAITLRIKGKSVPPVIWFGGYLCWFWIISIFLSHSIPLVAWPLADGSYIPHCGVIQNNNASDLYDGCLDRLASNVSYRTQIPEIMSNFDFQGHTLADCEVKIHIYFQVIPLRIDSSKAFPNWFTYHQRKHWQWLPKDRLADDRACRMEARWNQVVIDYLKITFQQEVEQLLQEYFATETHPCLHSAYAYVEDGLRANWHIVTLNLFDSGKGDDEPPKW